MQALNHVVPFAIMMTLIVVALTHVFGTLAKMAGLDGLAAFFGK